MKKIILAVTAAFLLASCENNEELNISSTENQQILSKSEINSTIKNTIAQTGEFNWKSTNAFTIWSAVSYADNLLTVGYVDEASSKGENSNGTASHIISLVNELESLAKAKSEKSPVIDETLKVIDIEVTQLETIEALLADSSVRYVEPAFYSMVEETEYQAKSDLLNLGCGFYNVELEEEDYRTVAPGALVPWTYDLHKISDAWEYSTGEGVTIGIIDTGLSPEQTLMSSNFNDGYSANRTVESYGTFVDSFWWWSSETDGVEDKCGHGSCMSAIATAPRNDNNLPLGVAYNSNLVMYRGVENAFIDTYHEINGAANAFKALGNRADVNIISMSLGTLITVSKIKDAVKYAYNKGKLIVTAGGSSTSYTKGVLGVIFPANMDETVAVTGLIEGEYTACDICHSGSAIDFTIQIERKESGKKLPVLSYYEGAANYIGGSSSATAATAGIAALVWSKNPTWTRDQVIEKLKSSAEFYPNKDDNFGYGNIDALKAVN